RVAPFADTGALHGKPRYETSEVLGSSPQRRRRRTWGSSVRTGEPQSFTRNSEGGLPLAARGSEWLLRQRLRTGQRDVPSTTRPSASRETRPIRQRAHRRDAAVDRARRYRLHHDVVSRGTDA